VFSIESLRTDHFDWSTSLSLATASKIAYERQDILADVVVGDWGFHRHVALNRGDTQGFIAIAGDVVLIAFRGTESIGDWLGNIDVLPTARPYGSVHRGFLNAYLLVEQEVLAAIQQIAPANPRLWITGHSLGGALATIAAAELRPRLLASGIHTFGQPRLGAAALTSFFLENFPDRFMRFVNDDDIVTRVPPGYQHVGKLIHFDANGNIQAPETEAARSVVEPPPLTDKEYRDLQATIQKAKAELRESGLESTVGSEIVLDATVEGFVPGLSDHKLDRYIAHIRRHAGGIAQRRMRGGLESVRQSSPSSLESVGRAQMKAQGLESLDFTIPILLRLRNPNWSAPDGVQIDTRIGHYLSANSSPESLNRLEADPNIESIEISRNAGVKELSISVPFVRGDAVHRPPIAEKGDMALVGIIDTGVDVLHEAFLDGNGRTRILAVWDQLSGAGPTPNTVDPAHFTQHYGSLYLAADIQEFIDGAKPTPANLRDPHGHGTHVASIAAGRAVGKLADGMAPETRIVIVIPKMTTAPGDPRSVGYSKSHFDGLGLLKSVSDGGTVISAAKLPMAVNVSLGMNAGAHDGTSFLEAGFDSITSKGRDPGFVIVKSAGNERGHGGHARTTLFLGVGDIRWQSASNFRSMDYFELWYDALDEVEFALIDPAGRTSVKVTRLSTVVTQNLGGNLCHLELTETHSDNGDNMLLIRISEENAQIQQGTWTLELDTKAIRSRNAQADIWVERDDEARAVRFVPEEPETTISIPGTADTVVTVGACHGALPLSLLPQSSYGLTRKGSAKPDVCAPGHDVIAALASGADHQATVAMSGTSMAAPHVTGAFVLTLSHRAKNANKPQHNARQLRAALNYTARPPGSHNRATGHGVLDAEALFSRLK
jgi:endonuclease G